MPSLRSSRRRLCPSPRADGACPQASCGVGRAQAGLAYRRAGFGHRGQLGLGPIEPGVAVGRQSLSPLPELHAVLEPDLAALELGDDRDQLVASLLVAQVLDVREIDRLRARSLVVLGCHRNTLLPFGPVCRFTSTCRRAQALRSPTGRTPKSPRATRTLRSSSASTSTRSMTIRPSACCTTAYPRSRVASGDSARTCERRWSTWSFAR